MVTIRVLYGVRGKGSHIVSCQSCCESHDAIVGPQEYVE